MHRMFPLIILVSIFIHPLAVHAESDDACPSNVISNLPQCIATGVFEGEDSRMPEGLDYEIAIDPPRDEMGNKVIPQTIPQALSAMHRMLPHWYINALYRSEGDDECNVTVNRLSYGGLIAAWVWTNWKLDARESPLRRQFNELGIDGDSDVEQAMIFGFCELVRHNEQRALQTITARGSPKIHPK